MLSPLNSYQRRLKSTARPAGRVARPDQRRDRLRQEAVARLAGADRLLRPLPLGQVEPDGQERRVAVDRDRAEGDLDRELLAVGAAVDPLEPVHALLAGQ